MKRILPSFLFLFIMQLSTFGQNRTYLGFEGSLAYDLTYKLEDPGGMVRDVNYKSPFVGLVFRQDLLQHFFLETGMFYKSYTVGVNFKNQGGLRTYGGITTWVNPFRLGGYIPLFKNRVRLVPAIGVVIVNSTDNSENQTDAIWNSNNDDILYKNTVSNIRNTVLLQGGGGFDFTLFKRARLNFNANYYGGTKKNLFEQNIAYKVNGGPEINAHLTSRGSFWCFGFSFLYAILNGREKE